MHLFGLRKPCLSLQCKPPLKRYLHRRSTRRLCGAFPTRVTLCHSNRKTGLRIVFVSPEVFPWSKVGGLADVLAALPQALAARGHQVMTVAPRYAAYEDTVATGVRVPLDLPQELTLPQLSGEDEQQQQPTDQLQKQQRDSKEAQFSSPQLAIDSSAEGLPSGEWLTSIGPQEQLSAIKEGDLHQAAESAAGIAQSDGGVEEGDSSQEMRNSREPDEGVQGGAREPAVPVQPHAEYHHCRQGCVDRVFVDHPLFLHAGIYGIGGGDAPGTGVYTYTHLAAHHHPLLELQYNILCQAALAAPLLLWEEGGVPSIISPAGSHSLTAEEGDVAAVRAVVAGKADSEASMAQGHSAEPSQQGKLVFCANDWPTALLPLRLHHFIHTLRDGPPEADTATESRKGEGCRSASGEKGPLGEAYRTSSTQVQQRYAAAVRRLYRQLQEYLRSAKAAYCIHNLAYQGVIPTSAFPYLSLPSQGVTGLCSGGDWKAELEKQEEQRRCCRRAGCHVPPPSQLPSLQQQQLHGSQQGKGQQHQQQERQGGDWQLQDGRLGEQGRQQRRWGWKRKLREHAAASAPATSDAWPQDGRATPVLVPEPPAASYAKGVAEAACPSGLLNLKQGALLASDALVTVSPGYAAEVGEDEGMGCGLQDIIAARGITGIMNGIDTCEWDPSTDPRLPAHVRYSCTTARRGKAQAKALLQEKLGLRLDPSAPLVGFVGRLTEQKGVDVLLGAAPALLASPAAPAPVPAPGPAALRLGRNDEARDGADVVLGSSMSEQQQEHMNTAREDESGIDAQGSSYCDRDHCAGLPGKQSCCSNKESAVASSGALDGSPTAGVAAHLVFSAPGSSTVSCRQTLCQQRAHSSPTSYSVVGVTNLLQPTSLAVAAEAESRGVDPQCESAGEDSGGARETGSESTGCVQEAEQHPAGTAWAAEKSSPGGSDANEGAMQLVVLGTGEGWMESALSGLSCSFRGQAAGLTAFSEEAAHLIMAAADYLLVPSRFEPCGLVAQCGVRYGAVPIVTEVGGLKDLVTPEVGYLIRPFGFDTVASTRRQNVEELVQVVRGAVREYGDAAYCSRQAACMALDVSWDKPAAEWEAFLLHMVGGVEDEEPGSNASNSGEA